MAALGFAIMLAIMLAGASICVTCLQTTAAAALLSAWYPDLHKEDRRAQCLKMLSEIDTRHCRQFLLKMLCNKRQICLFTQGELFTG